MNGYGQVPSPPPEEEDDLAAARGIILATIIGSLMWMVFIAWVITACL
jgi:hypothetical protein